MEIAADAARLQLMERAGIALDADVVIALGHDGDNETVFTGNVVSLRPALAGVEIHALGTMSALLNLRTASVFENETAGSIASSLIARAGLSAGPVDDGPLLPHFTVDDRVSAFVHVKGLAESASLSELYADRNGNIRFHEWAGRKVWMRAACPQLWALRARGSAPAAAGLCLCQLWFWPMRGAGRRPWAPSPSAVRVRCPDKAIPRRTG